MPESTCLHIQDRESGPIRVVEIPWISVRIGRAAYCEVRLPEHDLAEEVCRLIAGGGRGISVPCKSEPHPARGPAPRWLVPSPFQRTLPRRPVLLDPAHDRARRARLGDLLRARAASGRCRRKAAASGS